MWGIFVSKYESNTTVYHWQPELPLSITYWSFTFCILLLSIVGLFEATDLNWFSVIVFIIFCFLVWLGYKRRLVIDEVHQILVVQGLNRKKSYQIALAKIKRIEVEQKGIHLFLYEKTLQKNVFLLSKKQETAFLDKLKKQEDFHGKIIYFKTKN